MNLSHQTVAQSSLVASLLPRPARAVCSHLGAGLALLSQGLASPAQAEARPTANLSRVHNVLNAQDDTRIFIFTVLIGKKEECLGFISYMLVLTQFVREQKFLGIS